MIDNSVPAIGASASPPLTPASSSSTPTDKCSNSANASSYSDAKAQILSIVDEIVDAIPRDGDRWRAQVAEILIELQNAIKARIKIILADVQTSPLSSPSSLISQEATRTTEATTMVSAETVANIIGMGANKAGTEKLSTTAETLESLNGRHLEATTAATNVTTSVESRRGGKEDEEEEEEEEQEVDQEEEDEEEGENRRDRPVGKEKRQRSGSEQPIIGTNSRAQTCNASAALALRRSNRERPTFISALHEKDATTSNITQARNTVTSIKKKRRKSLSAASKCTPKRRKIVSDSVQQEDDAQMDEYFETLRKHLPDADDYDIDDVLRHVLRFSEWSVLEGIRQTLTAIRCRDYTYEDVEKALQQSTEYPDIYEKHAKEYQATLKLYRRIAETRGKDWSRKFKERFWIIEFCAQFDRAEFACFGEAEKKKKEKSRLFREIARANLLLKYPNDQKVFNDHDKLEKEVQRIRSAKMAGKRMRIIKEVLGPAGLSLVSLKSKTALQKNLSNKQLIAYVRLISQKVGSDLDTMNSIFDKIRRTVVSEAEGDVKEVPRLVIEDRHIVIRKELDWVKMVKQAADLMQIVD